MLRPQHPDTHLPTPTPRHAPTQSLCGHGSAINDIAVHPFHPHIVATASKDHTIRVWNLHVGRPVLICQGDGSHVNEILSLDWRVVGKEWTLVSAGMDSCVKIW